METELRGTDLGALVEQARRGVFPEEALLVELVTAGVSDDEQQHETTVRPAPSTRALSLALGLRPASLVHVVAKSARNPFVGMITVGRAANNDIVVDHPSVSKFHCYFRRIPNGLVAVDVGSKNGTSIEGRRLTLDAVTLGTLQRVVVGQKPFVYIARGDVRRWLIGHDQTNDTRP